MHILTRTSKLDYASYRSSLTGSRIALRGLRGQEHNLSINRRWRSRSLFFSAVPLYQLCTWMIKQMHFVIVNFASSIFSVIMTQDCAFYKIETSISDFSDKCVLKFCSRPQQNRAVFGVGGLSDCAVVSESLRSFPPPLLPQLIFSEFEIDIMIAPCRPPEFEKQMTRARVANVSERRGVSHLSAPLNLASRAAHRRIYSVRS